MQHNIIIAGVGGQGILSIAKAISGAAVDRGLHVKQAEVHGMSQRGGAVQSHLRVSDEPIHSDLVPSGRVGLLIAVEPLEALRYVHLLASDGVVVASANAFANIGNYPPVEQVIVPHTRAAKLCTVPNWTSSPPVKGPSPQAIPSLETPRKLPLA